MANGTINVYEEDGYKVIDLTKVGLSNGEDTILGALVDGDYGPELYCEKRGNDLAILYNGEYVIRSESPEGDIEKEYINYEIYSVENYFETNGVSDIKVKVDSCSSSGTVIEEDKLFDLSEVVTVSIGYDDYKKGRKIVGTFVRDDIDGTSFNDTIYGYGGDDRLSGNEGNDVIYGGDGDDHIWGEEGNDKLYGGTGHNSFYFDDNSGNDTIYSNGGEDTIVFEHLDLGQLKDKDMITLQTKGNDLIINYPSEYDNGVFKSSSALTIKDYLKDPDAHSVKNIKYIGDSVTGEISSDAMSLKEFIIFHSNKQGTDGNDIIRGSALDDTITGGKGNDKLYGGKGKNVFVFNEGDGNDTIYYEGGEDIIDLRNVGENLNVYESGTNGQIKTEATKQGNDLIIKYTSSFDETTEEEKYDTIRLANYFKNGQKSDIKVIIKNDEHGNPIYIDLKDFITVDFTFDGAKKGQKFTGTFLDDFIDGSDYNDVIHGGNGNDDIYGGLGNDKLYGDYGNNVFEFDVAEYGEENITFRGNGKDIIYSGKGNDLIRLVTDLPTGVVNESGEPQTRHLTIEDLKISAKGNSLIIHYTDEDSIELADYFKLNGNHSVKEIELYTQDGSNTEKYAIQELINRFHYTITGKEDKKNTLNGSHLNDSIIGGNLADVIKGGNGDDTIIGGKGNDKLYGGTGHNSFYFDDNSGNDTIYSNGGEDTIVFEHLDLGQLKDKDMITLQTKGNDLIINYPSEYDNGVFKSSSALTIKDYLKDPDAHSVKNIKYKNSTTGEISSDAISMEDFIEIHTKEITGTDDDEIIRGSDINDIITGGKGDDIIYGGKGKNTFIFFEDDGNDTIYYQGGKDIIDLRNVANQNVVKIDGIDRTSVLKEGNDLIFIYDVKGPGNELDTITFANYFKNGQKSDIRVIFKNDEEGNPIYKDFKDFMIVMHDEEDAKKGQKITGTFLDDHITGSDFADVIKGGNGDDTIIGGKGNDKLYGEGGKNTYSFYAGDGNDVIYSGKGTDTIAFIDKTKEDVVLTRKGYNLILQYTENDSVTIANYFKKNAVCSVKNISFSSDEAETVLDFASYVETYRDSSGDLDFEYANKLNYSKTVVDYSIEGGLLNDTITGSKGNDTIYGYRGHDIISGGNGDDIIYGGTGNDTLKGGNGNDSIYGGEGNDRLYGDAGRNTLYFNQTDFDGHDTVYGGKGYDTLHFKDLGLDELKFTRSGNNLIITYDHDENENSVNVANYFKNKTSSVKEIVTTDGNHTILADSDIAVNINGKVNAKNKITGTFLNDSIFGGDYNDTLSGGDGNDTIYGGNGKDVIKGGNGDDTIIGGKGNDLLYGDGGNNTLVFNMNDGNDTVYSGKGNDTLLFNDASLSDFDFYSDSKNNLIIKVKDTTGAYTDSVTIANYFKLKGKTSINIIKDKDGNSYYLKEIDGKISFVNVADENDIITKDLLLTGSETSKNKITGTYLDDVITGGTKNDTLSGGDGNDTINGGNGNDVINGGNGNDIVYGGAGNDKLYGNNGKDKLYGGDGNDYIDGGNDNDTLYGDDGNDTLLGGNGDDSLNGGSGNDVIKGGNGNDTIYGGSGDNKLYGEGGDNRFYFDSASYYSHDIVYMGKGHDTFMIDDSIDNIHYEKSGNHLVIKYGDSASITVNNYFSSKYKSVDTIKNWEGIGSVSLKDDIIIGKKYESSLFYNGESYNIPNAKYDGNEYNNLIVANDNKKLNYVDSGKGDDVIYCQGKSVIADAGQGNDVIYCQGKAVEAYGGYGDDTYVISSLKNAAFISDINGNDTVKIADKSSNINLIFNVATVSGGLNEYEGMYILNNATLSGLIKSRNVDGITSGITIANFFNSDGVVGNGAIERIESTNGYITQTQIDEVKASVVGWLTANNYNSAYEAFAQADKSTVNELVAIYQNIDWQQH